jgi:hypothetical protein
VDVGEPGAPDWGQGVVGSNPAVPTTAVPTSDSAARNGTRAASGGCAAISSCWFLGARLDGCARRAAFQLAGFPDHDTENDDQYARCNGSRRRAEIVGADTSDHCSDHESAHDRTEAEGLPSCCRIPVRDPQVGGDPYASQVSGRQQSAGKDCPLDGGGEGNGHGYDEGWRVVRQAGYGHQNYDLRAEHNPQRSM